VEVGAGNSLPDGARGPLKPSRKEGRGGGRMGDKTHCGGNDVVQTVPEAGGH